MADIVPFGKYRNQPLAALAQDRSYCDWLLTQGWLAERYPELHTIIINNFGEPQETPEHNALQLRFLDEVLRLKVSQLILLAQRPNPSLFNGERYVPFIKECGLPRFEVQGIDVMWDVQYWYPADYGYKKPLVWDWSWVSIALECKPTLGDDYPAVLRFMHRLRADLRAVIAESFQFKGGSVSQVQALFQASGVVLLHMHGIEELPQVHLWSKNTLPPVQEFVHHAP